MPILKKMVFLKKVFAACCNQLRCKFDQEQERGGEGQDPIGADTHIANAKKPKRAPRNNASFLQTILFSISTRRVPPSSSSSSSLPSFAWTSSGAMCRGLQLRKEHRMIVETLNRPFPDVRQAWMRQLQR